MPIEFNCNTCNKMLRVPEGTEGKACQCPSCGTISTVPTVKSPSSVASSASTGGSTSEQQAVDGLVRVTCPKCQYPLRCKPELMGSKGQCKQCKHIFVIGETSVTTVEVNTLVFSCPKCNQLFDGKPEMEGRKGKCHSCGEVFSIKLRQAETEGESQPKIEKTLKPASASAEVSSTSSQPKPSPTNSVAKVTSATSAANMQLICGSCNGAMEVPSTAAGKKVACPHCQQLLQVPDTQSSSTAPKASIFDQPSSSLFDSSPSSASGGGGSLGIFDGLDVPATNSSYPSYPPVDLYGAPPNYQPTAYPPAPYQPAAYQPTSYPTPYAPAYPSSNYQSPYTASSSALQQASDSEHGGNREWLKTIATWQGRLAWSILIYITSYVLLIAGGCFLAVINGDSRQPPPAWFLIAFGVAGLVPMVSSIISLVSYIVLCLKMYEGSKAVLYIVGFFVGACVPFLPFILMIVTINHATGVLRSYGIRAGFMGIDPSTI